MKIIITSLISKLFEPLVVLTVLAVVAAFHAGLSSSEIVGYLFVITCFMIIPVIIFRIWYMKTHAADWDVRDRKKRIIPLLLQMAVLILDIVMIHVLWHRPALTYVFVLFFVWLGGFTLVTTQWKISGHASTNAMVTGLLISWYGWNWWPVLLIVPLVGWARVVRGDHTIAQVIAGAAYSWILILVLT